MVGVCEVVNGKNVIGYKLYLIPDTTYRRKGKEVLIGEFDSKEDANRAFESFSTDLIHALAKGNRFRGVSLELVFEKVA